MSRTLLILATLMSCCLLTATGYAAEETIHFREGGGTGYTDVTFDDTHIVTDPADDTTHGDEGYNGLYMEGRDTPTDKVVLLAVEDLLTELPKTTGGKEIDIISAYLYAYRYQGSTDTIIYVNRMTTDWLPDAAGSNEDDVSGEHAEKSQSTTWYSGDFASSDYDDSVTCTATWSNDYNGECEIDVTAIVEDIYDNETNYGFALRCETDKYAIGRSSENSSNRPSLKITYEYLQTTFTLTVNSGSGDGSYAEDAIVDITADTGPSGQDFDQWVGDTSGIADIYDPTTTITMPAADAEITAIYTDKTWTLTVNSGAGDGDYVVATEVDITADAAPSASFFDKWIGDATGIADINDPTTTLTMPYGDAEITATYADVVDGLVSRFTFDIDAGDSYGTNDGTLTGGASVTNDGTRGKVLSLDGTDDYVSLPSSAMAAGRSELTLSLWVNPDTWASGDTIYDEYASANYWQFTVINGSFYTRDTSTGTTGSRNNDVSMPSLSTGSWQHLALVYSVTDSTKAIYLDGVKQGSSSTSIDALTSMRDGVGIGYACDGNHFDGLIDDVRLYSKALNLTELALVAEKTLYTLTVDSGSGDGDYGQNQVIDISADAAPSGKQFDEWIGDTSNLADASSSSTTVTMPAGNVEVTANYTDTGATYYTLTVNSGTGDGSYQEGWGVDIDADTAPSGKVFDEWVGDTSGIANLNDPTTTITMPASDAEITATYVDVDTYALTVNSGSGDGNYATSTVVDISADTAPSGEAFYKWIGDTEGIADVYDATTTITMPESDATITAKYTSVQQETVHFREGGGEGYESIVFDDTKIESGSDNTHGNDANITITTTNFALFAITDLFTELPSSTNGNDIQILGATLYLYRYNQGTSSDTIYVYRVTSDWLFDGAGQNENDVSFLHAEVSESTEWASGSFSASDYDSANGVSASWVDDYDGECEIDVTQLIADIYETETDYGLCAKGSTTLAMRMSENSKQDKRPSLEITYSYGQPTPMYMLTVNSGTGDGEHEVAAEVDIAADTAPSGMEFNMWVGDVDGVDDLFNPTTAITMPASDAEIAATYKDTNAPDDWWFAFDLFCQDKFGAEKEDLTYDHWGNTLQFMTDSGSEWKHASKTSAVIAFETNLPAKSYVEYGTTTSYGSQTTESYRYHYIQIVYLTGLSEDTTYHFRYVATDERDNTIYSSDKTFTTATPSNVVYVPGTMGNPPYTLSESGKTYLVTQNITAAGSVFEVSNDDITVDLGGYTVTYNNADDDPNDSYGIESRYYDNIKLFNGKIKQGLGYNGGDANALGNSPVYIRSCSGGEVAGVTAEYAGTQISGLNMHYSSGATVHHCVVIDRGGQLVNRHMGCEAINGAGTVHHNLVLRGRQRGITGTSNADYYNNEIYVDSVATNSFGVFLYEQSNTGVDHNRIFGTGYLMIGVGTVSGCTDIEVDNNFVHLHEMEPDNRWPEYGAQSGGYCCRITWGGDNLDYHDNTMITFAQDGGMVRGTWFYTEASTTDVICENNVVKAVLLNETSDIQGCIVVAGDGDANAASHIYENNRMISNFCNVRLGESYGTGCNTRFYDNKFVECGPSRLDYRTIQCGEGSTASKNHEFYDSSFEDGAGYDEVDFIGSGAHDMYVGWTLTVETEPYADVTIDDYFDTQVFSGQADANGDVDVRLIQYKETASGKTYHTPHEVTASKGGLSDTKEVTMDQTKTVQIPLN